jgi:hypothetical protein
MGTIGFGLILGGKDNGMDLIGWADPYWAQDPDLRRSITGYIFDVAGGSISWASKKQPTVTLSTVEAEYMAALQRKPYGSAYCLKTLGSPKLKLQPSTMIAKGV